MPSDSFAELGRFLTASEAEGLAAQLASGLHAQRALGAVNSTRRPEVRRLLTEAGLNQGDRDRFVAVLRAIAGAKSLSKDLTPVWTMPGNEAQVGHLTGEFHRVVSAARVSVVCATYNFQETSQMWGVLKEASEQPGVRVTVYVDGDKADGAKVKRQLPNAAVYESAVLDGKRVVSHAKFIVIDGEIILLTSANFSYSAEQRNVELGILIKDAALARSIESTIASKQTTLYRRI
ncbi:DISARM system phospholipase D-like protein DrmC [Glutamicibacter arilaitensis]|uniref:DISARM system phospholipase D-like protein DrmC n=1 Tax=Glutamicibacter arilaitensis TaxID=256701 RepID=UPI00384C7DED